MDTILWRLDRCEKDIHNMRPTADKVERMTTDIAVLKGQVAASIQAVAKAEGQMDKRLEGMNEFRDSLRDQTGMFATKETVAQRADATNERLTDLDVRIARAESRAVAYTTAVGIFVAILAVIARFL